MRGPAQGALASFSTLLLTLVMPPMAIISNALVAFIWLRLGPVKGAMAVGIALAAGTIVAAVSGFPLIPATLMLSFWLPVILMAYVLRKTVSLDLAILAGAVLALAGVLITYVVLDHPSEAWQGVVAQVTEAAEQSTGNTNSEQAVSFLANAGSWMTGFSAATQLVMAVCSLLLARVWQARMFNPGGLQQEFHGLRFGMMAGLAGLVIVLAAAFLQIELLTNLAIVVMVVFGFQGLAVLHSLVAQFKLNVFLLVAVYVMLLIAAPTSIKLIGLIGLADTWVDFRNRLGGFRKD